MDIILDRFEWSAERLPRIRIAGRHNHSSSRFETCYLAETHALHLHQYSGRIRLGEVELDFKPGDITITPAGVESRYDLPRPGHHWCVHFYPEAAGDSLFSLPLHISLENGSFEAVLRMKNIANYFNKSAGDVLETRAASVEMLGILLWLREVSGEARTQKTDTPGRQGLSRAVEYLESHLNKNITAASLAKIAGVSSVHFSRLFAERFDMSVPAYTNFLRVQQAKLLLHTTDLPVKNIGISVGLPDPHYFNRVFRNFTGHSPTQERNG